MPPVESGYLIGYLFEIGPTAGDGPITHEGVQAWQENVGVELQPWEVRFLRSLSQDYLSESFKALKPERRAPWDVPDPYGKAMSLKKSMRALANL